MISKIINNKIVFLFILPFLLGSISVFTFSPFNISIFGFISISGIFLLLTYVNRKSKNIYRKKPFLSNFFYTGFFFGFGFFLFSIYWISYSLTFEDSFKFLIPISVILIPAFLASFFGIIFFLIGPFLRNNIGSILIFSVSLSLIDYLRGNILTGFPWNIWVYSFSWFTEGIQLVNFFGLYGLNLISITIFCLPAAFFFKKTNKILVLLFYFLLFLIFYTVGSYNINKNKKFLENIPDNQFVNIKIISPDLDLKYNLDNKDVHEIIDNLIKYSEPDKDKKTIFVWPEGIFAGLYLNDISDFKKKIEKAFSKKHLIIFGSNTINQDTQEIFNSLVVVNNNFEILYQYNKRKLVPFGEFLPLEKKLSLLGLKKITEGYGSFTSGKDKGFFKYEDIFLLPLICYELIFPELVQKSSDKINLIINISEDVWFKNSIGIYQHFSKAVFRSIESNTYLVRAANKGISAFIDNRGNILKKLELNEKGNIEMKVPLINNSYKNKNDLIFYLLLFTYIIIFLLKKND